MKTIWRTIGGLILGGALLLLPAAQAATGFGYSPVFPVDLRGLLTSTLTGRVVASAIPVANAQVRVDGTAYAANTQGDGTFSIQNVPVGEGYVVIASADGYGAARRTGISVIAGSNPLGDLALTTASRPYHVIPLMPDVNPAVTEVEQGGTAYRYYQVVAADGKTPVTSSGVTLQIVGGGTIPQADVSDDWAGRIAGIPDGNGILRLSIPDWQLGSLNALNTLQVLESGVVQQTFQARVIAREYDQVWKHKVGGGVSGKIGIGKVGVSGAYESELRQTIQNGVPINNEQITRIRSGEIRAGLEVGGGLKIGPGGELKFGAGGYARAELQSTYHFSASSEEQGENAMKLYVAMGDDLSLALGPVKGLYKFVADRYEPQFLNSNLDSIDGELRLGGYAEASANLGLKAGKQVSVGAGADLSAEAEGIIGHGQTYGENSESSYSLGLAARASGSVSVGASFGKKDKENGFNFSLFDAAGETELRAKVVTQNNRLSMIEIEQTATLEAGIPAGLSGWVNYDPPVLEAQNHRELTETVTLPLRGDFGQLSLQNPIWSAISMGVVASVVRCDLPASLVNSLSEYAVNRGISLQYERSLYAAEQKTIGLDVDLDGFIAGLGLSMEGGVERGAEVVNERGQILRHKRMALESYPALTTSLFPQQSIISKEVDWVYHASGPIGQALNKVATTIGDAAENVVEAGVEGGKATLKFTKGVIKEGSQVVTSYVTRLLGGGSQPNFVLYGAHPLGAQGQAAYLPPPGRDLLDCC